MSVGVPWYIAQPVHINVQMTSKYGLVIQLATLVCRDSVRSCWS